MILWTVRHASVTVPGTAASGGNPCKSSLLWEARDASVAVPGTGQASLGAAVRDGGW